MGDPCHSLISSSKLTATFALEHFLFLPSQGSYNTLRAFFPSFHNLIRSYQHPLVHFQWVFHEEKKCLLIWIGFQVILECLIDWVRSRLILGRSGRSMVRSKGL